MTDQGNASLEYVPDWYHVGDPDEPMFSIFYGLLAMLTISCFEMIAKKLFFSVSSRITHADLAGNVTSNSATWLDLPIWLIRWSPGSRICWRALFGYVIRIFVFAADIGFVFLAVPRPLDVMENEVGSSQLAFNNPTANGIAGLINSLGTLGTRCYPDNTPYAGFSASATRQICLFRGPTRGMVYDDPQASELLSNLENDTELYRLERLSAEALEITALRNETEFRIAHTLTIQEDIAQDGSPFRLLLLPLPKNIVEQAVAQILQEEQLMKSCSTIGATSGAAIFISCRGLKDKSTLPELLFWSSGTLKVRSSETKFAGLGSNGEPVLYHSFPKVGSISRPRLCIIPATVLYLSLIGLNVLIKIVLYYAHVDGNLMLSVWQWFCPEYNRDNPIYSEWTAID